MNCYLLIINYFILYSSQFMCDTLLTLISSYILGFLVKYQKLVVVILLFSFEVKIVVIIIIFINIRFNSLQISKTNYFLKILFVGTCGVGKTAIINRVVYNTYSNEYKATLGVDFSYKTINMTTYDKRDACVKIQLLDIAGQQKSQNLTRSYYKDAVGCVIVADLSFEIGEMINDIEQWKYDMDKVARFPQSDDLVPCILMCNKSDIKSLLDSQIFTSEVKDKLQAYNFVDYYATSALTGQNIDIALEKLVQNVIQKLDMQKADEGNQEGLINVNDPIKRRRCC